MAQRKAFTLIELLVVIAIIAILAAILFPVFAQAKAAAKKTASLSNVKQLATGLQLYSGDADDTAVWEYGYSTPEQPDLYLNTNTWIGRISPYVKNRAIFWDATTGIPSGDDYPDPFYPGYVYKWQWAANLSLNTDGYSRHWGGTGCEGVDYSVNGGEGTARSLTAFEDPAKRLAITPVRYADLPYGWMRFYGMDASWPTMDRYASGFSWYQLVFDARRQYGESFVGAFADGHAANFKRDKFVGYYVDNPGASEATSFSQYCEAMEKGDRWAFWGRAWSGN